MLFFCILQTNKQNNYQMEYLELIKLFLEPFFLLGVITWVVLYYMSNKNHKRSNTILDDAAALHNKTIANYRENQKLLKEIEEKVEESKRRHINNTYVMDETNTPPEILNAIRDIVTRAEQGEIKMDSNEIHGTWVDNFSEAQYQIDLSTIKRLMPEIQSMDYDSFVSWLDKGKVEYIKRVLPIFQELGMEDKSQIIKGYLDYKEKTK